MGEQTWTCADVRYPGSVEDLELLRSLYVVDAYVDAMMRKERESGETAADYIYRKGKQVFRAFCPRIFRIAERVLERLGLPDGNIQVFLLNSDELNVVVQIEETKDGLEFTFAVPSSSLTKCTDDELAFWMGEYLSYELFDVMKYKVLVTTEGDWGKSVLPGMGNDLFQMWTKKEWVSADRIAAIAAGGYEACATALLKHDMGANLGPADLSIPSREVLENVEELFPPEKPNLSDEDFLPFRLKALRLFCDEWFAPCRGSLDMALVDAQVDAMFSRIRRFPRNRQMEMEMYLLADAGMEILAAGGGGHVEEIRYLVRELLDFTDDPLSAFEFDRKARVRRLRKTIRSYVKINPDGDIHFELLVDLARMALMAGASSDRQLEALRKILMSFSDGNAKAKRQGTVIFEQIVATARIRDSAEFVVDPLMEDLVAQVLQRWQGKPEQPWRMKDVVVPESCREGMARFRYSGDLRYELALRQIYRVDGYVGECKKRASDGSRSKLMRDMVRLTASVSPRTCRVVKQALVRLGYSEPFEVFCENNPEINACAWRELTPKGHVGFIKINAGTLEALDDGELANVIGHEMSHLIFRNGELGYLFGDRDEDDCYHAKLPLIGDQIFRRWNQMNEITADRLGLIAAGNLDDALRGMIKVCYGLSPRNMDRSAVDRLLKQIESLKDDEVLQGMNLLSHPLDPIRLKALMLFGEVCERHGYVLDDITQEEMDEIDGKIDGYLRWLRKFPRTDADKAEMQLFATAGTEMVETDGELAESEAEELVRALIRWYTEMPLDELVRDPEERRRRYRAAARKLRKLKDEDYKENVMRFLVRLAMADGTISKDEQQYLSKVAKDIEYTSYDFQSLEEKVVNKVGFPTDVLLEGIVGKIRESLGL